MTPNSLYAYCQYIGDNHEKLLLLNINCIILIIEKVDKIESVYLNIVKTIS